MLNQIWLDDIRPAPEGWQWIKDVEDLIQLCKEFHWYFDIISLDHDMGDGKKTGYDFLVWLEKKVYVEGWKCPFEIRVHSQNASAKTKMEMCIRRIMEISNENK